MKRTRFEDDKATLRAKLEERARSRETITYGEAAALVGRASQGLGALLSAIGADEAVQRRPDLGCLVVRSDTRLPGYVGRGQEAERQALALREEVFAAWRTGSA